jgi:hypothetical protein
MVKIISVLFDSEISEYCDRLADGWPAAEDSSSYEEPARLLHGSRAKIRIKRAAATISLPPPQKCDDGLSI